MHACAQVQDKTEHQTSKERACAFSNVPQAQHQGRGLRRFIKRGVSRIIRFRHKHHDQYTGAAQQYQNSRRVVKRQWESERVTQIIAPNASQIRVCVMEASGRIKHQHQCWDAGLRRIITGQHARDISYQACASGLRTSASRRRAIYQA